MSNELRLLPIGDTMADQVSSVPICVEKSAILTLRERLERISRVSERKSPRRTCVLAIRGFKTIAVSRAEAQLQTAARLWG